MAKKDSRKQTNERIAQPSSGKKTYRPDPKPTPKRKPKR